MSFQGFGTQALPFFKALAFHQSKEWFNANRETYERAVKGPMGDLVEDTAARLAQAKIPIKGDRKSSAFRIHRDVRFSQNKDPYKTHAGVVLTRSGTKNDPGVLYFHLSPTECFFAASTAAQSRALFSGCGSPRFAGCRGRRNCSRSRKQSWDRVRSRFAGSTSTRPPRPTGTFPGTRT